MNDAVAEIKARLSIEDVVSEYVELKRSGRNFKGLSPFANEKTPSFIVSPEKQIWHDFSSGKGGDVFSFIMEVEGMDFKASLELLARKAGVELEDFKQASGSSDSNRKVKERLFEAVEQAVKFYQFHLTKNNETLRYLREKRSYEKQTLIDFRFGYSPASGTELTDYLKSKGYSISELEKAGLTRTRNGRSYDMFRGRVMIPLLDPQGRPVGFTARQLKSDSNSPKYINTPATILYDKSRQVFGLSQAKEAIRKAGYAVVVEGNLDVVASHQAGLKQVVASAGTALTTYHLKSLQRFTGDIRLAFDDDRAGQDAAARTIPIAQQLGVDLSIIRLPTGKDPDDLIKEDEKAWPATVGAPVYMVDWLIDRIADKVDLKTAQGKRQFTTEILDLVRQLKDPVEQEHYANVVAEKSKTSVKTILSKLSVSKNPGIKRLKRVITPEEEARSVKEHRMYEQHILALGMKNQEIGKKLSIIPLDVFSSDASEVASFVMNNPGVSPTESEYGRMLSLLFEEYYQHTDETELAYQATGLISRLVNTYAKQKKQTLISEIEKANETDQKTLLRAVKQLDDLTKQFSK